MKIIAIFILLFAIGYAELSFSIIFFRHGYRKPLKSFGFEDRIEYLQQSLGELTDEGMYQMHEIGRKTKESLERKGLKGL